MCSLSYPEETNSQIHSISSDDSSDQSNNKKKTLGRVKIKTAYIENKIRRYTTFSKRKTGIMKKAYELATLTGTEVMLLVASETGHVYTYATQKLQPMITSDAGKALIQTCLAKDEPSIQTPTTLENNDVILSEENKRMNLFENDHTSRPTKHAKLNNEIQQVSPLLPLTTTVAVPLSYLINPNGQQQSSIDLNSLKTNEINFVLTPPSDTTPFVLNLSHFPYQPS